MLTTCYYIRLLPLASRCFRYLSLPLPALACCRLLHSAHRCVYADYMVSSNGGIPSVLTSTCNCSCNCSGFSPQLRSDVRHLLLTPVSHLHRLALDFQKCLLSSSQSFFCLFLLFCYYNASSPHMSIFLTKIYQPITLLLLCIQTYNSP